MSEEFNKFFISVFINEGNESIAEAKWMYKGPMDEQLCDIEITKEQDKRGYFLPSNLTVSENFGGQRSTG